MPTREDWKRMAAPILRGTAIGSFLGILPGGGALLASFAAYSLEKKVSPHGAEFGTGAIEGVAAPEAANNAGAQASFIPMLTLGIPTSPVMALMIGAMIIQGVSPGPSVMTDQPALFWGVIASMWMGNAFLLVLNLPMIGLWVRLCMVPYHLLYPAILVFCGIGVFSLSNSEFDIHLMALFGVLGYLFAKLECETAPMLLAMILGPLMEEHLRRALHPLPRRSDDLPEPPDQPGDSPGHRRRAGDRGAACHPGQARGGLQGGLTAQGRFQCSRRGKPGFPQGKRAPPVGQNRVVKAKWKSTSGEVCVATSSETAISSVVCPPRASVPPISSCAAWADNGVRSLSVKKGVWASI